MEATALRIRLGTLVLLVLSASEQLVDSASLVIQPNRPQFFAYEPVTFHCEGFSVSAGGKVVHRFKGEIRACKTAFKVTAAGFSCTISNAYPADSGEHWCEDGRGEKSKMVNITVTSRPVILESLVPPVLEGDAVTLHCRTERSSNFPALFFKDGRHIRNSSKGRLTILHFSKSDEGVYKCSIPGVGESPESRLTVRGHHHNSSSCTVWIVCFVLLLVVLVVVGLLHLGQRYRHRAYSAILLCLSALRVEEPGTRSDATQAEFSADEADTVTYAAVKIKNRQSQVTTVSLLFLQIHSAHSQNPDAVNFPQVVPNRQQHFEYESFSVSCEGLEGLTGWRVLRKINRTVLSCTTSLSASTGPCNIPTAFQKVDSGVYWCEMGGMKKSNTVNISITAGSVVLESPVLPVMEGHDVTLSCRQKSASSNLTAQFFKDGILLESSSTGSITLDGVTKDNEGVYRCQMPGAGQSLESWLHVRAGSVVLESPVLPVMEGHNMTLSCRQKPASSNLTAQFFKDGILWESSSSGSITLDGVTKDNEGVYRCQMSGAGESLESWLHVRGVHGESQTSSNVLLPAVLSVGSIALVLMLVVGLLHWRTRAPPSPSAVQSPISPMRQEISPARDETTYAVVIHHRRDPRVSRSSATQIHHEGSNRRLAEVDSCYDVIRY
ncbi:uncharacterized protein V6R79_006403 [Siganus canaliculatus]